MFMQAFMMLDYCSTDMILKDLNIQYIFGAHTGPHSHWDHNFAEFTMELLKSKVGVLTLWVINCLHEIEELQDI